MSKENTSLEVKSPFDLILSTKQPNYKVFSDYKTVNSSILITMMVLIGGMSIDATFNFSHYGSFSKAMNSQSDSLKVIYLIGLALILTSIHGIFTVIEERNKAKGAQSSLVNISFACGVGIAAIEGIFFFSTGITKSVENVLFCLMTSLMIIYSLTAIYFKDGLKNITIVNRNELKKSNMCLLMHAYSFVMFLALFLGVQATRVGMEGQLNPQLLYILDCIETYSLNNPMFSFVMYLLILGLKEFYVLVDLNEDYVVDMEENEKLVF